MPIIKQLKNAVKPSLHVGSETTCGPVTGLQYEVIGAAGRHGVSGSNDVAQSQKAALQRHPRRQENRSAVSKILLVLKAPYRGRAGSPGGNPTAHIREAQLTTGQQTPRK